MINQKLTDSIEHLSDHYIEEALDTPIWKKQTSNNKIHSKNHLFPRKLITAAAMVCIGVGIGYVTQNLLPTTPSTSGQINQKPTNTPNKTNKKSSIFSPLTVTAYAAERSDTTLNTLDEGITLPENVPIVLSQYSPLMSSVPAMPFSFSYQKEDVEGEIHFVVSADPLGSLQKYQHPGGIWKLTEEAKSLKCKPDEKIYWQPSSMFQSASENKPDKNQPYATEKAEGGFSYGVGLETENPEDTANPDALYPSDQEWINSDTLGADSLITVNVYEGETLLETQYIGISYQNYQYTATLKLSVTTEQWDEDDFTITGHGYDTNDEEVHKKILESLTDPSRHPDGTSGQVSSGGQAGQPSNDSDEEEIEIQSE